MWPYFLTKFKKRKQFWYFQSKLMNFPVYYASYGNNCDVKDTTVIPQNYGMGDINVRGNKEFHTMIDHW